MSKDNKNCQVISNQDLEKNKYNTSILINNISRLDMDTILKTQTLELDFVVNYILNDNYQITSHEKDIDILTVVRCQPHLKEKDIYNSYQKMKKI